MKTRASRQELVLFFDIFTTNFAFFLALFFVKISSQSNNIKVLSKKNPPVKNRRQVNREASKKR